MLNLVQHLIQQINQTLNQVQGDGNRKRWDIRNFAIGLTYMI